MFLTCIKELNMFFLIRGEQMPGCPFKQFLYVHLLTLKRIPPEYVQYTLICEQLDFQNCGAIYM